MKSNPYADLRIDNRADLPAPWYDYPVLQSGEYRTEILYTSGRDYVKVHIGQQDGAWVAARATILRGVTIGRDALVGATALVAKDVPAGTKVFAPRGESR